MFIFSRRKILFIVVCFLIIISFVEIICGSYIETKSLDKISFTSMPNTYIKYVNSIPVTNKTIILDAGHGFPDGGAVGINGIVEADINLQIVLKIQELLEESGTTVILTRSDENGIYDENVSSKKVSDIKNRVKIGNESSADIFVSIHLNKISDEKQKGWQTFYNKKSSNGKELSSEIQDGLNEVIKVKNNRKAKPINNIYIIDHVEIPTCIVECGFISNYEEAMKLSSSDYQDSLAYGIYIGIINYFYKQNN